MEDREAEGEHPKTGSSLAHGFYMFRSNLAHSCLPRLASPAIVERTSELTPCFGNYASTHELGSILLILIYIAPLFLPLRARHY